jgi:hypothetical protein
MTVFKIALERRERERCGIMGALERWDGFNSAP